MALLFEKESYLVRGAFFEVYKEKGAGFTEPVYHECLKHEFAIRNIPAVSEPELQMEYKGIPLEKKLKPDFVCFGKIIVELKPVKNLADEHRAQVQNYLRASGFKLGFLVNFAHYPQIQIERIVLSNASPPDSTEPVRLQ